MFKKLFIIGLIGIALTWAASSYAKPEEPIRIAVGSMITPKAGYVYYKQLLDYIEKKLGRTVKLIDKNTYAEVNNAIKAKDIDVAFVCGRPYVDGYDESVLELLAAPQVNGKTVYYSYLIVHKDSPVKNFKGLQGKTFAFADPMSNTGKLVPTYMLIKMGETPESFFKKYIFTSAHDRSVAAVANRIVDGAAVDSLIYDYLAHNTPEITSKTKVIEKSQPFGIPPVVVRKGLDTKLKLKIKDILLNVHKDPEGQKILRGMMIEKFVEMDDSAYNSIREMRRAVAESESKKR
ncbi:MAG: phosphate/phosphite/phosphonate ABC transporter substrate-binding protein [Nitrospirae bacterium]|nr:phosphate/phosphite/phosphonate ABC transporter substrate-binding protein [Nitrospirota bacterium]